MLQFIDAARLDRVGCFKYSAIEGAAANVLPDPVPEEEKEERYHRFMAVQAQISRERLREKIGKKLRVLVDEVRTKGAIARSSADAPEIDGQVFIKGAARLHPGDFVEVMVTGADDYDLRARLT